MDVALEMIARTLGGGREGSMCREEGERGEYGAYVGRREGGESMVCGSGGENMMVHSTIVCVGVRTQHNCSTCTVSKALCIIAQHHILPAYAVSPCPLLSPGNVPAVYCGIL